MRVILNWHDELKGVRTPLAPYDRCHCAGGALGGRLHEPVESRSTLIGMFSSSAAKYMPLILRCYSSRPIPAPTG